MTACCIATSSGMAHFVESVIKPTMSVYSVSCTKQGVALLRTCVTLLGRMSVTWCYMGECHCNTDSLAHTVTWLYSSLNICHTHRYAQYVVSCSNVYKVSCDILTIIAVTLTESVYDFVHNMYVTHHFCVVSIQKLAALRTKRCCSHTYDVCAVIW
jgi:hypothetical protein